MNLQKAILGKRLSPEVSLSRDQFNRVRLFTRIYALIWFIGIGLLAYFWSASYEYLKWILVVLLAFFAPDLGSLKLIWMSYSRYVDNGTASDDKKLNGPS